MAEHFNEIGALDRDQLKLLDDLSSQHLEKHGGDTWSGDVAGFLAGARQAVAAGSVPVEEWITLAETATQAAARARTDPALPAPVRTRQADELAAQAVGWLVRAGAAGYFRKFDHKNQLLEPRFDALRLRPSFPAPMADAFFPDDPFAGPP